MGQGQNSVRGCYGGKLLFWHDGTQGRKEETGGCATILLASERSQDAGLH
jgi:hypothetical protein